MKNDTIIIVNLKRRFKTICHIPQNKSAARQHGGDMLVGTAGDTKIPIKGRAGVVTDNIHLIYPIFIKNI